MDHLLKVFGGETQTFLVVAVAEPVRGNDAGRNDGEQVVRSRIGGDGYEFPDVEGNDGGLDPEDEVGMGLPDPVESGKRLLQLVPCPRIVANAIVEIPYGVHAARKDQVNAPFLQMSDEWTNMTENPVGEDSVGGDGEGSQSGEMGGLSFTNRLKEFSCIVPQKGLATGQVQLPEMVEFRRAKQLLPD